VIRSLWIWAVALFYMARYGIPLLVANPRRPDYRALRIATPTEWAKKILKAARLDVTVEGLEHLSDDQPAIFIANHQSWMDVFVLCASLPVDYRFVAKKELEGIPIFSAAWKKCGHISLDRGDLNKAIGSLEYAGNIMRNDRATVIMFPEGTRSRTGELQPFKRGAFVLAIQTGIPVVPAVILGTRDAMPKGDWKVRPAQVRVRIGAPIPVDGLGHGDREALSRVARDAVKQLMEGGSLEGPWKIPIAAKHRKGN
jgi:1-acyl-sn-glycerol-3-phosphate acyltransferase